MELELARFLVTPVVARREDGRTVGEDYGSVRTVFSVEEFREFVETCEGELEARNRGEVVD